VTTERLQISVKNCLILVTLSSVPNIDGWLHGAQPVETSSDYARMLVNTAYSLQILKPCQSTWLCSCESTDRLCLSTFSWLLLLPSPNADTHFTVVWDPGTAWSRSGKEGWFVYIHFPLVLLQWNSQRTSQYIAEMARCITNHSYSPEWRQGNGNIRHGNSSCTVSLGQIIILFNVNRVISATCCVFTVFIVIWFVFQF